MAEIAIIRAAFREIQRLTAPDLKRVYEILLSLSRGEDSDTKALQGYNSLRRTRSGDWRVIWKRQAQDVILVIKAGRRGDVYDNLFDERNYDNSLLLSELRKPYGVEAEEHPTYQWDQPEEKNWYQYVYGGYRYTPILTPEQRVIFGKPLESLSNPYIQSKWLVQSSPGTGKTVCATLLACELSQSDYTNVTLIIPDALKAELSEYSEVKKAKTRANFYIGTLRDWLAKIDPTIFNNLATPEEEFLALQEATRKNRHKSSLQPEEIHKNYAILYQAFVLDKKNANRPKDTIFSSYKETGILDYLAKIKPESWREALSNRCCRLDAAHQLQSNPPSPPPNALRSILIVDEAQDYLLAELQALMSVCDNWTSQRHPTHLWLLGDLNQRIQPTDFDWRQLGIEDEQLEIRRNYRNSQRILEFANQSITIALKEAKRLRGRHPIPPADPEDAFEVGESVRLLVYDSIQDADNFLQQLAQASQEQETQRYLLHSLANAVKVLSPHSIPNADGGLIVLNAERAKGREFEACVAFRLFTGTSQPSIENSFRWYTLLTRARSRLLIVATQDEFERVEKTYLKTCERIDPQRAIAWITEVASDVDLEQITDDVEQRLFERCRGGYLYWDTYLALDLASVDLGGWEAKAINFLRKHSQEALKAELEQIHDPRLRCLLLRAMHYSWKAVSEIGELEATDYKEYERIINAIAQELEHKNLPLEAARVRTKIDTSFMLDSNYPFPEIAQHSGSLVAALCDAFITRIES